MPPEYRQYAASMAQWFPEVLLLLGAPDLEEHYQPAAARVLDDSNARTVEVVLQRNPSPARVAPSSLRPDLMAAPFVSAAPLPRADAAAGYQPDEAQRAHSLQQLVVDYEVLAARMTENTSRFPRHPHEYIVPRGLPSVNPAVLTAPQHSLPTAPMASESDILRRLDALTDGVCQLAAQAANLSTSFGHASQASTGATFPAANLALCSGESLGSLQHEPNFLEQRGFWSALPNAASVDSTALATQQSPVYSETIPGPEKLQGGSACTSGSILNTAKGQGPTTTAQPNGRPAENLDETPRGRQVRQKVSDATTQRHVGRAAAIGRSGAGCRSRPGPSAAAASSQASSAMNTTQTTYHAIASDDDASPDSGQAAAWSSPRSQRRDSLSISIHKVQQLEAEPSSPKFVTRPKVWGPPKQNSDNGRPLEDRSADAIKERIEKKFAQMFGDSQGKRMSPAQLSKFKFRSC